MNRNSDMRKILSTLIEKRKFCSSMTYSEGLGDVMSLAIGSQSHSDFIANLKAIIELLDSSEAGCTGYAKAFLDCEKEFGWQKL